MGAETIKFIKHYTNKLRLLLLKYDNTNNTNIKNDIEEDLKKQIENFKIIR